jgi:ACT domain-containing protein
MMMIVDLTGCSDRVSEVIDQLANLGKEIGVDIRLQREDIFDNMHRI